jgi:hypothetical protein
MADRIWIFADNFIANAVGQNYTKAVVIAKYHLDALTANNADVEIAAREVIFQGLYNNLTGAATTKGVATGGRITDTRTLEEQFLTVAQVELPLWQGMIVPVAPKRSATYLGFFPRGSDGITKGRIDSKITAIGVLAAATLANGSLNAVSALITTRLNALIAKRNSQLGKKSTIEGLTGSQILAIAAMCNAHFIDHGLVITKFPANPSKIASFTDVENLQTHVHANTYEGTVNGEKTKTAAKHDFTDVSTFTITPTVDMQVWVIDSSKNIVKPTGVFIPAGIPKVVGFPALGNSANRVVQVKNLTLVKGEYTIVFS